MTTVDDLRSRGRVRVDHPADGMTLQVEVGDGAVSRISDPRSFANGGLAWTLTYGDAGSVAGVAASVLESYDYLLSEHITTGEAIRRLRIMRTARAQAAAEIIR